MYALGCVAYLLLAARLVFQGDALSMVAKHARDTPRPLSDVSKQSVPEDLERVIMACLEKQPSRRPASAGELDASLGGCACANEWSNEAAHQWWQQNAESDG